MKHSLIAALAIGLAVSLAPAGAFAAPGKGKGPKEGKPENGKKTTVTHFKGKFSVPEGVTTTSRGRIDYHAESNNKRQQARLRANVRVPVPSTVPAAADAAALAALQLTLVFNNETGPYASCALAFASEDDASDEDGAAGHFRLDVRKRTENGLTAVVSKKGECDLDLATEGVQAGVPAVQTGNTVEVRDSTGAFLNFTLNPKTKKK